MKKSGNQEQGKLLREDTNFNTITIEASPEESQDLIFLLSTSPGSIFLTLRHPSDHSKKRFPESTIDTLLGKVSQEMMNMHAGSGRGSTAPASAGEEEKRSLYRFIG